jgi:hypothetical protein
LAVKIFYEATPMRWDGMRTILMQLKCGFGGNAPIQKRQKAKAKARPGF